MFALILMATGLTGKEVSDVKLIGVYDSRAIAIGFLRSEVYEATRGKEMDEKMKALQDAQSSGDQKRIDELGNWGRELQKKYHQQGFSTASVDDLLELIEDRLPDILKARGIDLLVSKWDKRRLEKFPNVPRVDVTLALVDAFGPDAQQRLSALEILDKEPLPLESLKDHRH